MNTADALGMLVRVPQGTAVMGAERRLRRRRTEEEKTAQKVTQFPYKCPHCDKRCRTRRGQEQHTAYEIRIGCECGVPRCAGRGTVSYDNNHFRGRFVCRECARAPKPLGEIKRAEGDKRSSSEDL